MIDIPNSIRFSAATYGFAPALRFYDHDAGRKRLIPLMWIQRVYVDGDALVIACKSAVYHFTSAQAQVWIRAELARYEIEVED